MIERLERVLRDRLANMIRDAIAEKDDGETVFADELADKLIDNGVIVTPQKPRPVVKDGNPWSSDVYCPSCGSNQSGYYGSGFGYTAPRFVACYACGEYLDLARVEKEMEEEEDD